MLALAYLQQAPSRYLVFEDVLSRAGDPWLVGAPVQYITFDLEVYFFLAAENASQRTVANVSNLAQGYPTNGILTHVRSVPPLVDRSSVSKAVLQSLATGTGYILVKAYDNLGFIVWTK